MTNVGILERLKIQVSKTHSWLAGVGERDERYVTIFDNGKMNYAENENDFTQINFSGVCAILKDM